MNFKEELENWRGLLDHDKIFSIHQINFILDLKDKYCLDRERVKEVLIAHSNIDNVSSFELINSILKELGL